MHPVRTTLVAAALAFFLFAAGVLTGVLLDRHHVSASPPAFVYHPPAVVPHPVTAAPPVQPTTYPSGEQVGPHGGHFHYTTSGRKVYDRR